MSATELRLSSMSKDEPEDILSAFLGIVYNYTPITYSEAGSTFTYTYSGKHNLSSTNESMVDEDIDDQRSSNPLSVTLNTPDTQARNWELHASSIWVASVFIADHIAELRLHDFMHRSELSDYRRLEVLELGAGAGLPGILTAKYLERIELTSRTEGKESRNWRVTLSDYPDDLLIDTLRKNVPLNGFEAEDNAINLASSRVRVTPYSWGEDVSSFFSDIRNVELQGFDLILAADTLWNAALHERFAQSLYRLLRRSHEARIHLVAGLHTGRYTLAGFLRVVKSVHLSGGIDSSLNDESRRLDVLSIIEREVNGDALREWRVDVEGEGETERRRWVVWIVLGWRSL